MTLLADVSDQEMDMCDCVWTTAEKCFPPVRVLPKTVATVSSALFGHPLDL